VNCGFLSSRRTVLQIYHFYIAAAAAKRFCRSLRLIPFTEQKQRLTGSFSQPLQSKKR